MTSAAVLVIAPLAFVAGLMRIALPVRLTASGWSAAPAGSTICAVRLLLPW